VPLAAPDLAAAVADADLRMSRAVKRVAVVCGIGAIVAFVAGVLSAGTACAHDPRFTCSPRAESNPVVVVDVGKSWAFYGRLGSSQRDYYALSPTAPVSVPITLLIDERDAANPARPSLVVEDGRNRVVTRLDVRDGKRFDEPFSRVAYLSSVDRELPLAPGRYTVAVSMSGTEAQRYVLAIGRDERFSALEIPYVLGAIYRIHNRDF